jgi:hypothetical protein
MSAAEYYKVGAMQILVANGQWKFGPADRDDPGSGNGGAGAHIHHVRGDYGPAASGCLPHPVSMAMVKVSPNEARLAEERAYIPARWKENPDSYDQGSNPGQGHNSSLRESVNMLEGLTEEEADTFLQDNPTS